MHLSLSSLLITVFISSWLILLLNFVLTHTSNYRFFRTDFLSVLIVIIVLRICLPVEFFFTKTIPLPSIMNPLMDVFNYPIIDSFTVFYACICIWILGIIVGALLYLKNIRTMKLCFQKIEANAKKQKLSNFFHQDVKKDYDVYISSLVPSPMILGFKKTILLPDLSFTDIETKNILLHESQHLDNHDILIKQILNLLSILYWWFPPVHLLTKNIHLFLELRIDDQVANRFDKQQMFEYSNTLIQVQKKIQHAKSDFSPKLTHFLITDENSVLAYRIQYLLEGSFKKRSNRLFLGLLVLLPFLSNAIIFEASYPFPETKEKLYTLEDLKKETIIHHKDGTYSITLDGEQVSINDPNAPDFKDIPIIEE